MLTLRERNLGVILGYCYVKPRIIRGSGCCWYEMDAAVSNSSEDPTVADREVTIRAEVES